MKLPLHFLDSRAYGEFLKSQDTLFRTLWEKRPWLK